MSDPFHEGQVVARARKRRSIAIALALVAFVALVFAVTMVRMSQNTAAEQMNPAQQNMIVGDG